MKFSYAIVTIGHARIAFSYKKTDLFKSNKFYIGTVNNWNIIQF